MSSKPSNNFKTILTSFLTARPITSSQWKVLQNLSIDSQDEIISKTVNSDLNQQFSINFDYQKTFLKNWIKLLEEQNFEISDSLYEAYGHLVALPCKDSYFKHYYIKAVNEFVTLRENVHLISQGTTGLRTWQAALALAEWASQNSNKFQGKTILELGSGTGLTGISLAHLTKAKQILLTDCHPNVLQTLCENLQINSTQESTFENSKCILSKTIKATEVSILDLPWEKINKDFCQELGPLDLVIAADVVYDDSIFDALIGGVKALHDFCKVNEFLFCCTERNSETLEKFLSLIRTSGFLVEELEGVNGENFSWETSVPVRFFSFRTGIE